MEWDIKFQHTLKEGNIGGDLFADEALKMQKGMYIFKGCTSMP